MVAATSLQLAELASSLGIAVGLHGRRNCNADFSRSETTHLLRIADVLHQAQRLFGDRDRGVQWMQNQNRALGFKTPLAQLETNKGTRRVLELLRRMENGRFA
jgi:putative toxin-antitoxin system antitoxin component (TIGR02293 family)